MLNPCRGPNLASQTFNLTYISINDYWLVWGGGVKKQFSIMILPKSETYPKAPTATVASLRILSGSRSFSASGRIVAVFRGCLSFCTAEISRYLSDSGWIMAVFRGGLSFCKAEIFKIVLFWNSKILK